MDLCEFVKESNRIEGIVRDPTNEEINELKRFIYLDWVTLDDAIRFVKIYQPNAVLRDKKGLDVRVGGYYPPKGDKYMAMKLIEILGTSKEFTPFQNHLRFESLHPFTDCNGRLGRAFWLWQVQSAPLGFLHTFYYQSLSDRTK